MKKPIDTLDELSATATPELPAAIAAPLARWESATLETLGPIVSPAAATALHGAILNLREVLTAALAAS